MRSPPIRRGQMAIVVDGHSRGAARIAVLATHGEGRTATIDVAGRFLLEGQTVSDTPPDGLRE